MIRPLAILLSSCAIAAQSQFRPTRGTSLPPFPNVTCITSGDVDQDGDIDLVIGNDSIPNELLLNDGRGSFTNATSGRLTTPSVNGARRVDLVDVDGDGDLDLLLCSSTGKHGVHLNDGAGVFRDVSATAVPPGGSVGADQVVGDFDGDGDVDWLIVNTGGHGYPAPLHLYLNSGAGVFTSVSGSHLPAGASAGAVSATNFAADLDGDVDLDIGLPGLTTQVLLNQGGARFAFAPAGYLVPGGTSGHSWVGDMDRDGLADVFLNNGRTLLRNLGGGQFVDVSATARLPAVPNVAGTALDADLDGDLDVVGPDLLWLNDGAGRFTAANARGPAVIYSHPIFRLLPLHVADLDGDGDGDLVAPRASATPLHMNFLRQIDAPNPARIGQGYAIDMYVRPGFAQNVPAVVPSLAFRGGVTPLPPLGTLRLDPRSIHVLGVYFPPAPAGHVPVSYVVPSDANLIGLQLHHQAVFIEPPAMSALSNATFDVIR